MGPLDLIGVVTDREFPHGLQCAACKREIPPGRLYVARPESVTASGGLIEELVCLNCM